MPPNDTSQTALDPEHTFVGVPDLMARYGREKTTICALVKRAGFPGEVAPRRWRLDHVMAYEERAGAPSGLESAPEVPAGPTAVEEAAEEVDILAPRRPSRKAA